MGQDTHKDWWKKAAVLIMTAGFFVVASYFSRDNIFETLQQANINFTGAIWFGSLLLLGWLILLRTAKQPRPVQVMIAGAVSLLILACLVESVRFITTHSYNESIKEIWKTGGFWTLAALLISSPVAFVVWRFRDENQSKDINLKEFQKISEWVTGAHFQEEKHSEKFSGGQNHQANMLLISERSGELYPLNDQSESPSERSREYYRPAASAQALHSFSKRDGAVGLQIAAVYNLLPFYRGDYGQAFEKPSVHLLLSAWKVLQHNILQELYQTDDDKMREKLIKQLHQRADSPLGQAITRVLLACDYADKPLLHRHLEILPGICLSGMDFNLAGLESDVLRKTLFCRWDLTMALWNNVRGMRGWDLSRAELNFANLNGAWLIEANLSYAKLNGASLIGAQLDMANLNGSELAGANLDRTELYGANLLNAKELTAKQLLATEWLAGSLIDTSNFSRYTQPEQQQLQEKGLIVLHKGRDAVSGLLVYQHKTKTWTAGHTANSIPFPIDLAATRAANPDWEISIDKDDEEQ